MVVVKKMIAFKVVEEITIVMLAGKANLSIGCYDRLE